MPRTAQKSFALSEDALFGVRLRVPNDPVPADLGDGPAVTVHILPSVVAPEKVVFVAKGYEMEREGYWIDIGRLRNENDWLMHLSEKKTAPGHTPALVMLIEA